MEYLEPEARRRARFRLQLQTLRSTEFDLGLFQEVNPLLERVSQIESEVGMTGTFQSDLVGVKVLGMGLPNHLNSGLLTLAADRYQLRRVKGVKLSGPPRSFVSPWLSFQLQEGRYALLSEFIHPDWGRVLVANTHLHHGLELTESLEEELRRRAAELGLSSSVEKELLDRLRRGNQRRLREIKRLLDEIRLLESRYSVVILGGDLNSRPEGEVADLLKSHGFEDSFTLQNELSEALTFDREKNLANHRLLTRFPLSVRFEDLSFSKKITLSLKEILIKHEQSPRRIDQIWVKGGKFRCRAELIGLESEEGFAPSDHFGYLISLEALS